MEAVDCRIKIPGESAGSHPMAETMQSVRLAESGMKTREVCDSQSDGSQSYRSCTSSPARSVEESPSPADEEDAVSAPEVIAASELEQVLAKLEKEWGDCCGLYVHGSTIFANQLPNDLDLIAVIDHAKREVPQDTPDSQFTLGRCEVLTVRILLRAAILRRWPRAPFGNTCVPLPLKLMC